jgi:hypothetical protein
MHIVPLWPDPRHAQEATLGVKSSRGCQGRWSPIACRAPPRSQEANDPEALDAHRDGLEVSVRGVLEAGTGNSWRMSVAENFNVLEQSADAA